MNKLFTDEEMKQIMHPNLKLFEVVEARCAEMLRKEDYGMSEMELIEMLSEDSWKTCTPHPVIRMRSTEIENTKRKRFCNCASIKTITF